MSHIQIGSFLNSNNNKYLVSNLGQFNQTIENTNENVDNSVDVDDDDDDDDDTTLTEDLWSSTPTTSSQFSGSQEGGGGGRSSNSSIPWAEDAIKQNEDEWKLIEEMFYGEKPLPENKIIRDEILEWTKRFPHIRVIGEQLIENINNNVLNENENNQQNNIEEIIAIDPLPIIKKLSQPVKPSPIGQPSPVIPHTPIIQQDRRQIQTFINGSAAQNLLFNNNRKISFQKTDHLNNTLGMMRTTGGGGGGRIGGIGGVCNIDLQNQIEKCLRITSGPLLSRRKSLMPPQSSAKSEMINKLTINTILTPTIREEYFSRRPRVTSVRSDAFLNNNGGVNGVGINRRYSYQQQHHQQHHYQQQQQQQQQDQQLQQHHYFHNHRHNHHNNKQRTLLSPIKLPLVMSAKLLTISPSLLNNSNKNIDIESNTTPNDNLRKKPKLQSRFTLPALDFQPKFQGELIGRSISAINQQIPTSRY